MKKSLLIALAAITVISANAQLRAKKSEFGKLPPRTEMFGKVQLKSAQKADGNFVAAPKKIGANKAFYYRPQGTFYVNWDPEGSGYIMPYLTAKPYQDLVFTNASTTSTIGSVWNYDEMNYDTQVRDTLAYEGVDFSIMYGEYFGMVPRLTTANGDSYVCTQGAKVDENGAITAGPAYGGIMSVVNTTESTGEEYNWLASPHYYGSSNRALNEQYGWTYYSGAPGPNYNPELEPTDPAQDRSGYWFGRNWGDWNAFASAVEKPLQPYVLNRVYAWATAFKGKPFNVDCRVYRLEDLPKYQDGVNNEIDPATFDDDHLIAHGSVLVTSQMIKDGDAILAFDLEAYDPDLDMDVQVTPEIDFPILIVMSGYQTDDCQGISFLVTTDEEDEGWGEFAFNLHTEEDGTITQCVGLNNFFTSGEMKPGTSIMMDVSLPFLLFNYVNETGEYTFPAEGGNYTFAEHEGVSILSSSHAEDVYVELEDGSDVPEWLNIELEDVYETYQGEQVWTGTFDAKVTCEPLPDGIEGREAKVKFYINGAYVIYDFKQGNVVEPANKLYVIGDDPLGGWNPEAPIEMTENEETEGVFTYTVNVEEAKDIYFVFTEGIGSWAEVNGHRYGPTDANQDVVVGENMTTQLSSNDQAAYRLAAVAGEYTITFNKNTMTFRVDGEVAPEPDYKLHYGVEGAEWQDATFVPGEGENEGKLVAADVEFAANTEFKVNHGAEWYGGVAEEGEEAYLIHYGWCENIPLDLTGKNFRINEAGTYTFVLTIGEESKTLTVLGLVAPGVPGDSNGDGVVDIADVNSVINQMLGKEAMIPACDMNGDGVIDIADVNAVINKMLGK